MVFTIPPDLSDRQKDRHRWFCLLAVLPPGTHSSVRCPPWTLKGKTIQLLFNHNCVSFPSVLAGKFRLHSQTSMSEILQHSRRSTSVRNRNASSIDRSAGILFVFFHQDNNCALCDFAQYRSCCEGAHNK